MRPIVLLLALFAPAALAQSAPGLPLLYTVTGVAANDSLNLRAAPEAGAADIGDLAPGETVEIMRLSDDGKWGRVETTKATGWVSMHYMALTPDTVGDGTVLPVGMPRHMTCRGAEPFWELVFNNGESLTIGHDGPSDWEVNTYPVTGMDKGLNTTVETYAISSPSYTAVLQKEACLADFTQINHGWSMALVFQDAQNFYVMSGCCTATLN